MRGSGAESSDASVERPRDPPRTAKLRSCGRGREQRAHPDQVVGRRGEGKDPLDLWATAVADFPQQCDRFHPAEGLLDQLALALTDRVAHVARGARIDGTAATRAR